MGRFTVIALLLAQLIAISMACGSQGSQGSRRSQSTQSRPRSQDLPGITFGDGRGKVYPEYNDRLGTFGAGASYRVNDKVDVMGGAGVDRHGNPGGHVGVRIRFRRGIENKLAGDDDISMEIFAILDYSKDGQLDVTEWTFEGGHVLPFADMIRDHDNDADEMISLEEFLVIPLDPKLIAVIKLQMTNPSQDE